MTNCIQSCATCGFLALKVRETRELVEMPHEYRKDGTLDLFPDPHFRVNIITGVTSPPYPTIFLPTPVCSVLEYDFSDASNDRHEACTAKFLNKSIDCRQFTPWRQGFSPKEHAEIIERQKEQQQQRDWQAEQFAISRKHEERSLFLAMCGVAAAVIGPILQVVLQFILANSDK